MVVLTLEERRARDRAESDKWRRANPERARQHQRNSYQRNREATLAKIANPADKVDNIARMGTASLTRLLVEIEKCDVVCANCHAMRTHDRAAA